MTASRCVRRVCLRNTERSSKIPWVGDRRPGRQGAANYTDNCGSFLESHRPKTHARPFSDYRDPKRLWNIAVMVNAVQCRNDGYSHHAIGSPGIPWLRDDRNRKEDSTSADLGCLGPLWQGAGLLQCIAADSWAPMPHVYSCRGLEFPARSCGLFEKAIDILVSACCDNPRSWNSVLRLFQLCIRTASL